MLSEQIELLHLEPWQAFIWLAIFLVLMFQRRFRFIALTAGALAAGAESLSALLHAHFTGALGHAILAGACWAFAVSVAAGAPPTAGKSAEDRGAPPHPDRPDWSPR